MQRVEIAERVKDERGRGWEGRDGEGQRDRCQEKKTGARRRVMGVREDLS